MNARLLSLAMMIGVSLPVAAQAQMLAPGLWELTTSNMKVDNQDLPDLSLILGQLKQQMTPEQRAMLEKQGITMAGKGVQVCLPGAGCLRFDPADRPAIGLQAGSDRQDRQPVEIPLQLPESPRHGCSHFPEPERIHYHRQRHLQCHRHSAEGQPGQPCPVAGQRLRDGQASRLSLSHRASTLI